MARAPFRVCRPTTRATSTLPGNTACPLPSLSRRPGGTAGRCRRRTWRRASWRTPGPSPVCPPDAQRPFDPQAGRYWLPVDQYTGGVEHAVMHLLYTRFWTKVMRDMGLVSFSEPMLRLFNQGVILGEDGEKMSKSRGNVVNPDEYVNSVGADTVRVYLMFIGPWEGGGPWNSRGI